MGIGASVDVNTPDKYSGLTKRQKFVIRDLWKNIEKETEKHSVKIFIRFFAKFPHYRKYFVSHTGGSMTQLAQDAHVQSHFRAIIHSISTLIKAVISKPKTLEQRLNYIAMLHKDMGLNVKDFGNFREVLVDYLRAEFTDQMTVFEISAWNQFLTTMFRRICATIDNALEMDKAESNELVPQKKKTGLRRLFSSKKEKEKEFWQERRTFWMMQKELWAESRSLYDMSEPETENSDEKDKDISTQFGEAVTSFIQAINPDAEAAAKSSLIKGTASKEGKPAPPTGPILGEDIPIPEGGFARRGSQAPRAYAGNMRPRSPSGASPKTPPGMANVNKPDDSSCVNCSPARTRRRNSFYEYTIN